LPLDLDTELVDEDFLQKQMPGLDSPCKSSRGLDPEKDVGLLQNKKQRVVWYKHIQVRDEDDLLKHCSRLIEFTLKRVLLRNPIIPLIFRLIIFCFSVIALGLGASIFSLSNEYQFAQRPSTLIAIIIDAVALVYVVCITYDEYTSKPLGLRPPGAKMRLILLDLFFIIFDSANLSLAFESLVDDLSFCENHSAFVQTTGGGGSQNDQLCQRQKALGAMLLVALVAWVLTFTVSVFR
jgi:hypothetical protein